MTSSKGGRPEETVSSKRGRNRLKKQGDKLVSRTLKLLDKLYQAANQDDSTDEAIAIAFKAHAEILPFIKPKLQAVGLGDFDNEGNLSPALARQIAEEAQRLKEQRYLTGGYNDSEEKMDSEGLEEGATSQGFRYLTEQKDTSSDTEGNGKKEGEDWAEGEICLERSEVQKVNGLH